MLLFATCARCRAVTEDPYTLLVAENWDWDCPACGAPNRAVREEETDEIALPDEIGLRDEIALPEAPNRDSPEE